MAVVATLWYGARMSASGVGRLYKVVGTMNKEQYQGILQNCMLPSMADLVGEEHAVFQQDNDPKHKAKTTTQWLEAQDFEVLDWPAQSPELEPHRKPLGDSEPTS